MKTQRVNPNAMNPMQMNNMSSMMGMMNSIQKIGKGKRKYSIMLDKNNKKFLAKFIDEVKKQFASSPLGTQGQGVSDFFDYVTDRFFHGENSLSFSFCCSFAVCISDYWQLGYKITDNLK